MSAPREHRQRRNMKVRLTCPECGAVRYVSQEYVAHYKKQTKGGKALCQSCASKRASAKKASNALKLVPVPEFGGVCVPVRAPSGKRCELKYKCDWYEECLNWITHNRPAWQGWTATTQNHLTADSGSR